MKRYLFPIIIAIAALLAACEKYPANGDLDGQWQLMEISTKDTPTDIDYSHIASKKEDGIYWNFQLNLLMIRTMAKDLNGYTPFTAARFIHQGKKLDITSTYIHFRECDSLLTDPSTTALEPIGISGNAEKFEVQQLNNKRMVLTTPLKRLTFRKF